MESLYWVFTLKCNDFCDHCYNNSGPKGEVMDLQELLKVVPNLPPNPDRIILSGGEPLSEMNKLLSLVKAIKKRFRNLPVYIQTNGDLLNQERLRELLECGVNRIDISSLDRYHKYKGERASFLRDLLLSCGLRELTPEAQLDPMECLHTPCFKMWGATEDIWLGGNWARGRALQHNLALKKPDHNFCALWSGAKGFLNPGSGQEVHIKLSSLYPCCPTTHYSLGDVREKSVMELLDQCSQESCFQTLNEGNIQNLGMDTGLSREFIQSRIQALGDVCLWCDEYFQKYYSGTLNHTEAQN